MNENQKITNEIFKSIDIITDKKIQDTAFSMSITGQIIERIKSSDMYKVNYQNEEIRATSMGAAYNQGDTVIILVPDKRMDSLKFILGRANDRTPTISVSQTGGLSPEILAEIQAALEAISNIGSDDKITPSEKTTLAIQWENLKTSYEDLTNQLDYQYPSIEGDLLRSNYYRLQVVMDEILADMTTTIDFLGSDLRMIFGEYYNEDQAVRTKILEYIISQTLYKVEISSSNGSQFINGNINTTLVAKVYKGLNDITSTLKASEFKWTKRNHLGVPDAIWNDLHKDSGNSVVISSADMTGKATFDCDIDIE